MMQTMLIVFLFIPLTMLTKSKVKNLFPVYFMIISTISDPCIIKARSETLLMILFRKQFFAVLVLCQDFGQPKRENPSLLMC